MQEIEYYIPNRGGLSLNGGGKKIVLHTTEGPPYALPPLSWYNTSGYVPNLTIALRPFQVWRHIPDNLGAYTLQDLPGGITTNRAGDIEVQIEIQGKAETLLDDFTTQEWTVFGEWLYDYAKSLGIPWIFREFVAYPASYGSKAWQRMGGQEFIDFAGICAHEHVPENDHGDSGLMPIELFKAIGIAKEGIPEDTTIKKNEKVMELVCCVDDQVAGGKIYAIGFGRVIHIQTGVAFQDGINRGWWKPIEGGYNVGGLINPKVPRVSQEFLNNFKPGN
jgi:hypothetical protein